MPGDLFLPITYGYLRAGPKDYDLLEDAATSIGSTTLGTLPTSSPPLPAMLTPTSLYRADPYTLYCEGIAWAVNMTGRFMEGSGYACTIANSSSPPGQSKPTRSVHSTPQQPGASKVSCATSARSSRTVFPSSAPPTAVR
ncbi:unnamed protein product [Peniophora sp. CBMAI 1063]|nr:unnamed protein product [Peniophora sp. CBMAI 1063]